jgi:hypothetical protein
VNSEERARVYGPEVRAPRIDYFAFTWALLFDVTVTLASGVESSIYVIVFAEHIVSPAHRTVLTIFESERARQGYKTRTYHNAKLFCFL